MGGNGVADAAKITSYRVTLRGAIKLRDLLAAGKLTGVPVTAGMMTRSIDELPMEVFLGVAAVYLIREHPALSYDAVLDLIDAGEVELVVDNTDPKSTSGAASATS